MTSSVLRSPSGPGRTPPLRRAVAAVRRQVDRWLDALFDYWSRQPLDRFWPPHP
jgi:hypothetical protein